MGWAYLTQVEAQRTIEPNTLTGITDPKSLFASHLQLAS
jgi:hypothetical protein